ncbi:unnamed protein product [Caenorhabditis auriculariae]|uniref:Uncharacterized protein n=1 Tax=Caenorhabditis auriculariae TaxID=2777116 RepID=A0A8S1HGL2_9PELO|nr:unnamed protein product [Caenorhabditis auriculariae]
MLFVVLSVFIGLASCQFGGRQEYGQGFSGLDGRYLYEQRFQGPYGVQGPAIGPGASSVMSYEAKGRLMCGTTTFAQNVRVVMWDRVKGRENIIYAEELTDVAGGFSVKAERSSFEGNGIAPFLTIYHDCNDEANPGLRKMTVQLPPNYTNRGTITLKSYDIGTWNLETSFAGEEIEVVGDRGSNPIGGIGGGGRGDFGGRPHRHHHREDREYEDRDRIINV